MRYSDKPIYSPKQDLIGRARFAARLAKSIDDLAVARDGFVISVLGDWGTGKTSVIHMVLRYLRHIEMMRRSQSAVYPDRDPKPKTLDELEEMGQTFDRIEARLNEMETRNLDTDRWEPVSRLNEFRFWLDSEEDARIADEYWRLLRRIQKHPRTVVVQFSPWLLAGRVELASAFLSELGRAIGHAFGDEVKRAFGRVLKRLSEFAPVAGVGAELSGFHGSNLFSQLVSKTASSIGDKLVDGPTLDEVRHSLTRALSKLEGQQALIVIDDLDRLTPNEALEMVSLVKSLGSLPNVIYLLSYEENRLAELINKSISVEGRVYLSKIVQYSVVLPPVPNDRLWEIFSNDIKNIVEKLEEGDVRRLSSAWYFVIRHYVNTPRSIRLLVNSFVVAYSGLRDHIDPTDLLLIETMRLHEPEVYELIRTNLDDLSD